MEIEMRPIPGLDPESYAAGSDGNIYSRKIHTGACRWVVGNEWRRLSNCKDQDGYSLVSISDNSKRKLLRAHRLVCSAFHGKPKGNQQCRHLDGTKDNNVPENLAWGTCKENLSDRIGHGTALIGSRNPASKTTYEDRKEIVRMYMSGVKISEISRAYGISWTAAKSIADGTTLSEYPKCA